MNLIARRAATVLALAVAVAGTALGARPLVQGLGGLDASGGQAEAALWCVGIPGVHYGDQTVYPGGEVCVPGP